MKYKIKSLCLADTLNEIIANQFTKSLQKFTKSFHLNKCAYKMPT